MGTTTRRDLHFVRAGRSVYAHPVSSGGRIGNPRSAQRRASILEPPLMVCTEMTMEPFDEGLRCQDVQAGLRNVHPASGVLRPLMDTRLVGMAATLASLIRGQDVIGDASALQAVAAEQLDVDLYAFDQVVGLLEERGYVNDVVRSKGKITRFNESVPFYTDLYRELGDAWPGPGPKPTRGATRRRRPPARGRPGGGGGTRRRTEPRQVGCAHSARPRQEQPPRQGLRSRDGDLAYSPFYAFEKPQAVDELVAAHGSDRLAEEFAILHSYQGLPVDPAKTPLIADAVAKGFLLAPGVDRPDGAEQPFATLPYLLSPDLLTARKPVLEKALAVVACLRCGEHFGGYSDLPADALVAVINKLLDPNRGFLMPHSSHERQYGLLHKAGLIAFDPDLLPGGKWVTPRSIDTPDNREALLIAKDLLQQGEMIGNRVGDDTARAVLAQGAMLTAPMQTVAKYRPKAAVDPKEWTKVVNAAMSREAL
jgi:hypothetical protein